MIRFYDSVIMKKVVGFLRPPILLFAFYVFFHGHHSPGGGFQAGVLIAAVVILKMLVGSEEDIRSMSIQRELLMATAGLFVYASAGLAAMFWGGNYLDYGSIRLLGEAVSYRRFLGILWIEFGVVLVVSMTLVVIFHQLAWPELIEKERPS